MKFSIKDFFIFLQWTPGGCYWLFAVLRTSILQINFRCIIVQNSYKKTELYLVSIFPSILSRYLLVPSQNWKYQINVWNLFKISKVIDFILASLLLTLNRCRTVLVFALLILNKQILAGLTQCRYTKAHVEILPYYSVIK